MTSDLKRLKRLGWAIRAVFALGIAASLAGNVLHAQDNAISQAIAAWSPLSLLLAVELISRVPVSRGAGAFARLAATAVIAGIAAWVSYWHMVGVAQRYGESGPSSYLIPFSVDGLIVIASVSLVEIGGRIRRILTSADHVTTPAVPVITVPDRAVDRVPSSDITAPAVDEPAPAKERVKRVKPRPASAAVVTKVAARMPGASTAAIAEKAGVSPSTVRRHLAAQRVTETSPTGQEPAKTPALATA